MNQKFWNFDGFLAENWKLTVIVKSREYIAFENIHLSICFWFQVISGRT